MTSITENCQNCEFTIDLSEIFNKTGYINESDRDKYKQNNNVTHIILIQSNNFPIKIGDNFLYDYRDLISVDTSKIVNVIAIGKCFLFNCCKLTNFDTTGLKSLMTIGMNFLGYCSNLINFNATKLTSLTTIGDFFLSRCHNLINFNATRLTSLTAIGDFFLYNCPNLINFNATGLMSLTTIGKYCFYNCNENLTIIVKNPPDCLHNELLETNYTITQLYNKPIIYLVNDCAI